MSGAENHFFGPVSWQTIYGVDGEYSTPYMTRVNIGRLRLHIFHRGDADPDCHDHPWPFWTFPLVSYVEEVFERNVPFKQHGIVDRRLVKRFRLHYRPAEYAHRVLGPFDVFVGGRPSVKPGKIVTIVWQGGGKRAWGFWKIRPDEICWVPWKRYVYEGGKHAPCEESKP